MSNEPNFLDVVLLGREFRVACPPGEYDALLAAVGYVNGKMQEIAGKTRGGFSENLVVMVALNIAHEYLSSKTALQSLEKEVLALDTESIKRRIKSIEAQLDEALPAEDSSQTV